MIVKYASRCDRCGERSEEYHHWPICVDCGRDTCLGCQQPGTATDRDEEANSCRCVECADPLAEQVEAAREERR
jgi:hypothetical protein